MRRKKQLINDPYTALNYILANNTAITSLLGKYLLPNGNPGTIPLIKGGVLAKKETDYPRIIFYSDPLNTNRKIEDATFLLNCMAKSSRDSYLLARTIVQELNGGQEYAGGYPCTVTCIQLGQNPDPTQLAVNTVVEIRLYNINGGA